MKRSTVSPKTRVFISMCTFNGDSWVESAIEGVLNQSYTNWFLSVIDDGSSDDTKKILLKYQKNYPYQIQVNALSQNSWP